MFLCGFRFSGLPTGQAGAGDQTSRRVGAPGRPPDNPALATGQSGSTGLSGSPRRTIQRAGLLWPWLLLWLVHRLFS